MKFIENIYRKFICQEVTINLIHDSTLRWSSKIHIWYLDIVMFCCTNTLTRLFYERNVTQELYSRMKYLLRVEVKKHPSMNKNI